MASILLLQTSPGKRNKETFCPQPLKTCLICSYFPIEMMRIDNCRQDNCRGGAREIDVNDRESVEDCKVGYDYPFLTLDSL